MKQMYKDLIDRIDGYTVGTTIVEENRAYLITDKEKEIDLDTHSQIEIQSVDEHGAHYTEITYEELLNDKTADDGIPLFAGFYARVKK
jgi:hypothetical protein